MMKSKNNKVHNNIFFQMTINKVFEKYGSKSQTKMLKEKVDEQKKQLGSKRATS